MPSAQRVHLERDPTVIELLHQVTHCNTKVELFLVSIEASEQEERFWAIWWGLGAQAPTKFQGFSHIITRKHLRN